MATPKPPPFPTSVLLSTRSARPDRLAFVQPEVCAASVSAPFATIATTRVFATVVVPPGIETAVALCYDRLVLTGVLDLSTLVTRLSSAPARVLGLPGGTLAPQASRVSGSGESTSSAIPRLFVFRKK